MKTALLHFVLFISFTFIKITYAQENNYGIGESTVFVQPVPAEGNSAGIDFSSTQENFIPDPTKDYKISFDSHINEIKIEEIEFIHQEIVPLNTGTEEIDFEEINYNNDNPQLNLADFYYSVICESRTYGYAWYLNYDWTNFQERLTTLGNQGYRIENIDTYGRNVFNYAGTWTQDAQGWAWVLNYTSLNDFITVLNNWQNGTPRNRPIDFTMNPIGSQLYYGAVAKTDNLGFGWIFNENLSGNFITWVNNQYSSGRRLVEIQLYRNSSGTFMAGGISKDASFAQQVSIDLTWNQFVTQNNQLNNSGYRLVDFDQYYVNGTLLFGGLWNNDGIGGAWSINEHNSTTFQTAINNFISGGFKPMMLDVYDADWAVSVSDNFIASEYLLEQNYPNPFNPSTVIRYQLSVISNVTLKVYDILGNEIATLVNEEKPAGQYEVEFNLPAGRQGLSSGIYFYSLKAGDFVSTKKMILLK